MLTELICEPVHLSYYNGKLEVLSIKDAVSSFDI